MRERSRFNLDWHFHRLGAGVDPDDLRFRLPHSLSLEEVALIFERDLATLSDSQLAQLLAEARHLGPRPLVEALAPLARDELARRRAANPPVPKSLPEDFPSRA